MIRSITLLALCFWPFAAAVADTLTLGSANASAGAVVQRSMAFAATSWTAFSSALPLRLNSSILQP